MPTLALSKIALISVLAVAGYDQPEQQVQNIHDEQAATIVSNLLSADSRTRFQELLDADNLEELTLDQLRELEELTEEAGSTIQIGRKPFF